MIVYGASEQSIRTAIHITSTIFGGNIRLKKLDRIAKKADTFRLTVTVASSNGPGSRHGYHRRDDGEYRRVAAACWHAYGVLMRELFSRGATCIKAGMKIYPHHVSTNYVNPSLDRNIGSMYRQMMYSQACDCELGRWLPTTQADGEGEAA